MSKPKEEIRLVLARDQRIDARGNTIPPGTLVATLKFEELPGTVANLGFLASALSNRRIVDENLMPKGAGPVKKGSRKVPPPPMPDLKDK